MCMCSSLSLSLLSSISEIQKSTLNHHHYQGRLSLMFSSFPDRLHLLKYTRFVLLCFYPIPHLHLVLWLESLVLSCT